jgi:hypothetical protein
MKAIVIPNNPPRTNPIASRIAVNIPKNTTTLYSIFIIPILFFNRENIKTATFSQIGTKINPPYQTVNEKQIFKFLGGISRVLDHSFFMTEKYNTEKKETHIF